MKIDKINVQKFFHPFGRCTCSGESTCGWCNAVFKKLQPSVTITKKDFQLKLDLAKVRKNDDTY